MTQTFTQPRSKSGLFMLLATLILVLTSYIVLSNNVTLADSPSLNLTELMYSPASDIDGDEFIELYNTTGAPLDISGWCFTSGVDGCFDPSTIIPTGGYALAGGDAAQFNTTYGKTLNMVFASGKLSNGGEQIVLKDASNNTVVDMTYDDVSPWPSATDGNGPSMELKDALLDPAVATNWASSLSNGGTPGELNSVANTNNPSILEANNPNFPAPSTNMLVTATTENTSSATIAYKVNFDADVTTAMFDDGTNGDATPNDGIYSFNIPGQSAGDLIRYKITATNATTSVTNPPNGDGMNYRSFIVDDGQTADIPIVRWYIEDSMFTDLTTNHLNDNFYVPAVIAIGGEVFDNAQVRVKGQSSTAYAKKKFKFEMPSGYTVKPSNFEHAVDEFSINVYFSNLSDLLEPLSWRSFEDVGYTKLQNTNVRVQKNNGTNSSEFYGHYLLIETYDKAWRERNKFQEGALYKEGHDKKTREDEDNSDIESLKSNLAALQGDELKTYLEDNLDIPNIVNYHATSTVIGHQDWTFNHNLYQYRDTEGTGRWEYLPWDLDNALSFPVLVGQPGELNPDNIDPLRTGEDSYNQDRPIENALFQFPEFRDMYYRRVATVYDQLYTSSEIINWYDAYYQKSSETINEDLAKWSTARAAHFALIFPGGIPWDFPADFPFSNIQVNDVLTGDMTAAQQDAVFRYGYNRQLQTLEGIRYQGYFPQPQVASPNIVINEVMYNPPGGSDHEFLELHNPNNYAVDISGWKLDGINLTIPQGTVLPSKGYGLVVKNDVAYRQHYGGSEFIISEYNGKLANEGETISLLRTDNSLASRISYQPGTSGWPGSPNGQGYSLELIRTSANTEQAACWAPSTDLNGTPGNTNNPDQSWIDQHGAECKDTADSSVHSKDSLASTGDNFKLLFQISILLLVGGLSMLAKRHPVPIE
jgi:hypothetical protein